MVEMMKVGLKKRWGSNFCILLLFMLIQSVQPRRRAEKNNNGTADYYPPVQLHVMDDHLRVDNGILNITLSTPGGMITGIQYNGIDNLLEDEYNENDTGYWDVVWSNSQHPRDMFDKLEGTKMHVTREDADQVELSFVKTWNSSDNGSLPLNIDKRFIMLRGCSGFYSYAIFERLQGWPGFSMSQGRIVFKLQHKLFNFMSVSDDRQRTMPTIYDRDMGQILDYPEAVLLTDPANPDLKGEVDDKYQYSSDNKDSLVHGWISTVNPTGFWVITPSNEFKTGGPVKQDITSHAGPISLSMFFSTHYSGQSLIINFQDGEPWRKVFGPVFIYLNKPSDYEDPSLLWEDAKKRMLVETEKWPYDFPLSEHFLHKEQRGAVFGRLLVSDSYINKGLMTANSAYIGLALPGETGSWQRENKGYQFWIQADKEGYFELKNVLVGNYSLYAWVPGFIGDYKCDTRIIILPGRTIRLENLIYYPPRRGPTQWEIGIPDRTTAEFYIPDPYPVLTNKLYTTSEEKFRQYGLWDRYTDMYPNEDLVYTIGSSIYDRDWYFAQVNRNAGNKTYIPTTWRILFDLKNINKSANYTLQVALASATGAELQVRINKNETESLLFTTGLIGGDNSVARHGIHGLYWLYGVDVPGSLLVASRNTLYLTQSRGSSPWRSLMYDYMRFEGPFVNTVT